MPNYEDHIDGGWDAHVENQLAIANASHEDGKHTFDSSGAAYDASQCDDRIKDGDLLVVPSEKLVGILYEVAYPVAVTKDIGVFGHFIDGHVPPSDDKYAPQIAKAIALAKELGFEVQERLDASS
jgi:hypothetical protein